MAFGQPSGPPASAKQVQELLTLLQAAGHSDFRDARGPMGFNQRQAAGKFTRDEVAGFIEQLEAAADSGEAPPTAPPATGVRQRPQPSTNKPVGRPTGRATGAGRAAAAPGPDSELADIASERLAAELQRRGWVVMEP